eukprot:scaffold9394_cov29-Prasinocladus_malaysianus.AAC.1
MQPQHPNRPDDQLRPSRCRIDSNFVAREDKRSENDSKLWPIQIHHPPQAAQYVRAGRNYLRFILSMSW